MGWMRGLLIALGLVVVLVIAMVAALGMFSSERGKQVRHVSIGERTIAVSHYGDFTQEVAGDGVKIVVDGHTINWSPNELAIDGKAQNVDPTQDLEISVDQTGEIAVKPIAPEAASPPDAEELPPE